MIELNVLSGNVVDLNVNDNSPTALEVNMATSGGGGGQLSDDVKQALLQIAENVAYINDQGQIYYDDLYNALYPLVSIQAVYTQSGTVYDTDSLDSLKSDLVVTAVHSGGTTETVTTYTLSGSLEVGTSTITVAYGGKTTTFNVTVSYRYSYSYSNGDINKINGGYADIDIDGQLRFGYDKRSNKINVRRAFYKPSGDNAFYEADVIGGVAVLTDPTNPYKYPIPVPQDAVGVKATVTPSTQFVEISLINYSSSIQYGYVRGNTARWTQGTDTFTFNAGDYGYVVVATKYNSSGTTYPTEPTELTIEFLTE